MKSVVMYEGLPHDPFLVDWYHQPDLLAHGY